MSLVALLVVFTSVPPVVVLLLLLYHSNLDVTFDVSAMAVAATF